MRIMLNSEVGTIQGTGASQPVLAADDVWFSFGAEPVLAGREPGGARG